MRSSPPPWLQQAIEHSKTRTPSPEQIASLQRKLAPWVGPETSSPPASTPPSTPPLPVTPLATPATIQPGLARVLGTKALPWLSALVVGAAASWLVYSSADRSARPSPPGVPSSPANSTLEDLTPGQVTPENSTPEVLLTPPPPAPSSELLPPAVSAPVARKETRSTPEVRGEGARSSPQITTDASPPRPSSEIELLQSAQAISATQPVEALRRCQDHERRFPHGVLAQEREVLMMSLLRQQGRNQEASTRATRFLSDYPTSVHRRRIEPWISPTPTNP